jgi:DNA-binding GntR family transcriptional regulator
MSSELEYYNLSHLVYRRVKKMIIENKLKQGEKINQEKLASDLGVSRMPLHKAFQQLENELLVEYIPRRGVFVKAVDLQLIADALECRELIEGLAARYAAKEISEKDIEFLQNLFLPFKKNPEKADTAKYEEADKKFHEKLRRYIKNSILDKVEALDNVFIRSYQKGLIRDPGITFDEHQEILDALSKRKADKAEALIRQHLRKSREMVLASIEKQKAYQ